MNVSPRQNKVPILGILVGWMSTLTSVLGLGSGMRVIAIFEGI
jgi:hypothetical protein